MRKAVPITGQEEGEAVFPCPAAPLSRRACSPQKKHSEGSQKQLFVY